MSVFGLIARSFKRDLNSRRTICIRSYQIDLRSNDFNVGVGRRSKRVIAFAICRAVNIVSQVSDSSGNAARIMYGFRFTFPRVVISQFLPREGRACDSASSLRISFNSGFFLKNMCFCGFAFFKFSIRAKSDAKRGPKIGSFRQLFFAKFRMCFVRDILFV